MNKCLSVAFCLMLIPAAIHPMMDELLLEDGERHESVSLKTRCCLALKKACSVKNGIKWGVALALVAIFSTGFSYMISGCGSIQDGCDRMEGVCLNMNATCNTARASIANATGLVQNVTDLLAGLMPKFENAEQALELLEAMREMSVDMIAECPNVAQMWGAKLAALAISP